MSSSLSFCRRPSFFFIWEMVFARLLTCPIASPKHERRRLSHPTSEVTFITASTSAENSLSIFSTLPFASWMTFSVCAFSSSLSEFTFNNLASSTEICDALLSSK
uniref:Secreted protein n=1 Tax=Ascaris lumbricoides TaxID=6252 RepID=A0A0M3I4K8_ASCLU